MGNFLLFALEMAKLRSYDENFARPARQWEVSLLYVASYDKALNLDVFTRDCGRL